MKKWLVVALGCVSFVFMTAAGSRADITAEELLQILIEKGIVTQEDIEKAKASRKPAEEAPAEAIEEEEVSGKKEKVAEEKVVVEASRKPKRMNLKGRVQARFMAIEDGDLSKVTSQKPFDESEFDGFSLRRVRLRWFGDLSDQWKYHVQLSVDGDHNADRLDPAVPDYELKKNDVGVMLQDAYFTYDRHPYFNVTAGQFKSRFSPSYLAAGPVLPLCERPLVIDKLARRREIGVSIESAKTGELDGRGHGAKLYDKPIFYAVGVYNGNGMNKMRNDNDEYMPMGMLVVRPSPYINFGASYAYDKVGYDYETTVLGKAELSEDGEYYVFPVAEHKVAQDLHIWDVNSAFDAGPVHIQAEYVQQDGPDVARAYGYGIQGQVDLSDFFQLTARYDEFDPNVDVDNSFDSRWYTLGYNWFIHGQDVKWQLNYSFRDEMHGEDVDNNVLVTHFQLLF